MEVIDVRECGIAGFRARALVADMLTVMAEYQAMGFSVELRGVIRRNMQILQLVVRK